ncbi:platelet-activating factor acetylhydrolase IB subunit beta [Folsomia candida]|uniref:Platelet-activating factor acetylhydrolase IB subunit beta n=1 Tax=Folsomia candida TaxID=158441 RepID=A0A226CW40_FOLCA|nr:platelet-activating factor acetylhydrolase IB subunit beta [Folsomia candida]OXA37575.1 Platelet-activating factor acetylhydrolase IB subunit beta [Folsomia candida]
MKQFFVIAALITVTAAGSPWIPEPQEQQDWMPWLWLDRHQEFVNNSQLHGANLTVIFFGDSITEAWDYTGRAVWDARYAPLGAANYGIGADRVEHVLWRIINGEVDNVSPKLCVVKIGTNNIWGNTEFDIARGVAAIVNELRSRLPTTKILLLGVLPRHNVQTMVLVDKVNEYISILDNGGMVRFFNMRDTYYVGDGVFNNNLFDPDMIHLSGEGYSAWNMSMDALFTEMWNSK